MYQNLMQVARFRRMTFLALVLAGFSRKSLTGRKPFTIKKLPEGSQKVSVRIFVALLLDLGVAPLR
jgi:hypothetical protein